MTLEIRISAAIATRANREYGQVMNENMKFLESEKRFLEEHRDPLKVMRMFLQHGLKTDDKTWD